MSARALIDVARSEGLILGVESGNLVIETDRDPPAELIAQLREHKAELLALLRPSPNDDPEERAAIVAQGIGVPRAWAVGYAAIRTMAAPAGFSAERWRRVIEATNAFLGRWGAEALGRWGAEATRCGWSELDLFGCHDTAPAARFDCMGLILLLDRVEIVAIDRGGAELVTVTGARQRFYRRPMPPGTVPLWELVQK